MELTHPLYPMRAVIRCQARQQALTANSQYGSEATGWDEALLNDVAATLFESEQGQQLLIPYWSQQAVNQAEAELATAIATTYQQIMEQRQSPVVQELNALL